MKHYLQNWKLFMLKIKKIIFSIFIVSVVFTQGTMNSFGLGHFYDNQGIASAGNGLSVLSPSFQMDVSLTNPSTWENLDYTFLSLSYSGNENSYSGNSLKNGYSGLSNASWIVPVKSKGAFGLTLAPYLDQRVSMISKDTSNFYAFDDTLNLVKSIDRSGGVMVFKMGSSYLLNEMFSLGVSIDLLFGSSRQNESIFFDGSSIIRSSRARYSGILGNLYLATSFKNNIKLFTRLQHSLKPMSGIYLKKHLFDDANGNGYHDQGSPKDFPVPDSISALNEFRINEIHNPFRFGVGLQKGFNKLNTISIEYSSFEEKANLNNRLIIPANDWIKKSQDFTFSVGRNPNNLSSDWKDKFSVKTGLVYKSHKLSHSNIKITEIGGALGLGFKFKAVGNQFDVNYYLGKRDYSEKYSTEYVQQLQFGVSLADQWFVKRRQK